MPATILEAKDITFKYADGTRALNELSMKIPAGKKIAVLGPNGAGKSTLFLHFNGIHRPDRGEIIYDNEEISYKKQGLKKLRKNVGFVFQDPDMQLFSASVLQEISFGPINLGLSETEVRERVERVIEVTGLSGLEDKPTHLLSYGQKKKVAIADILAMKPKVIIFDEPTAWLDPFHSEEIMNFLSQLHNQGITVVISTHDVNLSYTWADYIYIMYQGTIIGDGKPGEVFQDNSLLQKANLTVPWTLQVYQRLKAGGLLPEEKGMPGNKDELMKMIDMI